MGAQDLAVLDRTELGEQCRLVQRSGVVVSIGEHALVLVDAHPVVPGELRRAVHMEGKGGVGTGRLDVRLRSLVKEAVRFVEDDRVRVGGVDLVRGLLLDVRQFAVGAGAERGRQAAEPTRARPRLVVKVVADDALGFLEVAGDEAPHVGKAVGDSNTARTDLIGVKVIVGMLQCRVNELVARKAGLDDVRPAVHVDRPVGKALALKLLVEHVLVLVDEGGDAVAIEQLDGLLDRFKVCGVVLTRLGLDLLPDDAEAHRGEALVLEELRVFLVEA